MSAFDDTRFVRLGRRTPAVLYSPPKGTDRSGVAVLVMHSDADYLSFSAGEELSARGHLVLCANVSDAREGLDDKIAEVGTAVEHLRARDDVDRIVLLGHSGGATLMSAYQNLAENGAAAFQGPEKLVRSPDRLNGLLPADGLMLIDSNWGNGAMRLFSLDPAVLDERTGLLLDPELDLWSAANGFDPAGSRYDADFIRRFQTAQGERNERLIDHALERLAVIEAGEGAFLDDEPLVVPGAEQGFRNNRLFAQDTRLMSRTLREHELVRLDGSTSLEVVRSMRGPENDASYTGSLHQGALVTTVRTFLDSYAVRTTAGFGYDESAVRGIDWSSTYSCTTGNVVGIAAPLLVMGMTAGWEFAAAEGIHDAATSEDRTLLYIEGANHMLRPAPGVEVVPGGRGDTLRHAYDAMDGWIGARAGRSQAGPAARLISERRNGDHTSARSHR